MKICTYTIKKDTGFAPNPFHGYCTLATCTPNHMGARLDRRDSIGIFVRASSSRCLVCTILLGEILGYDSYYHDGRFEKKKPVLTGPPELRCGDNIYHRNRAGKWVRDKGPYHQDPWAFEQDTRYARVYIGTTFAYFGENAYDHPLPPSLRSVLKKRQGLKYTREGDPLFKKYWRWLESQPPGVHGQPRDLETSKSCSPKSCKNEKAKKPRNECN